MSVAGRPPWLTLLFGEHSGVVAGCSGGVDMTREDQPAAYRVGYKKPPQHSQFKKGSSGNPRGRPRGAPNLATLFERVLQEQVVVSEHGRRRKLARREAVVLQLCNRAASGDIAALRELMKQLNAGEERYNRRPTPSSAEVELGVELEGIKERLLGKLLGS
jgi:hypothetical protein